MSQVIFVYTTWPDAAGAEYAAREIVRDRLAACANVLPPARSFYMWQGKLEDVSETVVIFKTTIACDAHLNERIKKLHPAEVPCIVNLKVDDGHEPFLAWVHSQLGN